MNHLGKFLALLGVGIGIWDSALSQDSTSTSTSPGFPQNAPANQTRYLKQGEAVMVTQEGTTAILSETVTLNDGSMLTPQGLITRKNGEEVLLGEEDSVGIGGVVIPAGAGKDYIGYRHGRMWRVIDGRTVAMIKDTVLTNGLTITLQGELISTDKTRTKLQESQVIGMDGEVTTGVIDVDQVSRNGDKIWITKGGETKRMVKQATLDDQTRVEPDGTVSRPDGTTFVMKEGDILLADGMLLPAVTRDVSAAVSAKP